MLFSSGNRARTARRLLLPAALAGLVAVAAPAAALAAPPAASAPPVVTGTLAINQTLTTTLGTWSGASSYSYDWQLCSSSLASSCFTLFADDQNSYDTMPEDAWYWIRVVVRATNAEGTTSSASSVLGPVTAPAPGAAPTPTIELDDTAMEGSWAWADIDYWANVRGSQLHYQWQRGSAGVWLDIPGATDIDYQFEAGDVGNLLRVKVTAATPSTPGGTVSAPLSATVGPVSAGPPWADRTPALYGTFVREGETVIVVAPSWHTSLAPTLSYVWQRCGPLVVTCAPIAGASGGGYTFAAADVGYRIRVGLTATNAVGSDTVYSAMTQPVGARAGTEQQVKPRVIDTVAPTATVVAPKRTPRLGAALKSGVPVAIRCSEVCTVTGQLLVDAKTAKRVKLGKSRTVGKVNTALPAGRSSSVKLRFDKAAARKLARAKKITLTLQATVRDASGNRAPMSRRLTLKR